MIHNLSIALLVFWLKLRNFELQLLVQWSCIITKLRRLLGLIFKDCYLLVEMLNIDLKLIDVTLLLLAWLWKLFYSRLALLIFLFHDTIFALSLLIFLQDFIHSSLQLRNLVDLNLVFILIFVFELIWLGLEFHL